MLHLVFGTEIYVELLWRSVNSLWGMMDRAMILYLPLILQWGFIWMILCLHILDVLRVIVLWLYLVSSRLLRCGISCEVCIFFDSVIGGVS